MKIVRPIVLAAALAFLPAAAQKVRLFVLIRYLLGELDPEPVRPLLGGEWAVDVRRLFHHPTQPFVPGGVGAL